MNHIFIKKVTVLVLFSLFTMIISPHYLFPNNRIRELEEVKRMYEQGNYDSAFTLLESIINTYDKEKYKDELCEAYYYRAKIFFSFDKYSEMRKPLLDLYQANLSYEFPSGEDKEFIEYALEIREEVRTLSKNEDKEINEHVSIPITINITNKIPDDVFICVDDMDFNRAKPIKQNRVELDLFPGEHRFYFILKSKGKVLVEDLEVREKVFLKLPLIFSKGRDIKSFLPKYSSLNQKVIEKAVHTKKKKKKFPILLAVVGTGVVIGALFFLLKKKENSNSSNQNNDSSDQSGKIGLVTEPEDEIKINERDTKSLKVNLSQKPQSDVTVSVEVNEKGRSILQIITETPLKFNQNNYKSPQTVTIEALNVNQNEKATIKLSGDEIVEKEITVTVVDKDGSGNTSMIEMVDSGK